MNVKVRDRAEYARWARWRQQGARKPRPAGVRYFIPAGWWIEYKTSRAPTPVPNPPSRSSVFSGKGLFTTSDAGSASGHPCDWVAVQKDPEGDQGVIRNQPGTLCWWQARPTQDVADEAVRRGIPYIGQAENRPELDRCLALENVTVPKALVGNAQDWGDGAQTALAQGWDYISEWYANAHPWEHEPTGHDYPRFVNVCFGIYSEGEPGGQGYVKQIPLANYLAVWHGSFSIWKAEAMAYTDWAVFDAA